MLAPLSESAFMNMFGGESWAALIASESAQTRMTDQASTTL
jgi:hypothetical protein